MAAPPSVEDLALRRAQRMLRQMKSQPFVALVVDEGGEDVHVYHTTGIDREALAAIRQQLDDIEASLPPVGGT